jgi:hypothetical protein
MLAFGIVSMVLGGSVVADSKYTKADYEKKVKTNDFYVGVVAAVINGLCPKLVKDKSVCNDKKPVETAVAIQKVMLSGKQDVDDVDEDVLAAKFNSVDAAFQFYDAVEQFKLFLGQKTENGKYAKAKNWKKATIGEEQAWQYIVKVASRAAFAAKMVGDTKTYKMIMDLAADY